MELVSYCKFGISRPDLDGTKLAKGKCLVRKVRLKSVYLEVPTEGHQFFLFEFKPALKRFINLVYYTSFTQPKMVKGNQR